MYNHIWTLQRGLFTYVFNINVDWMYDGEHGDCLVCTVKELPNLKIIYYSSQERWHDAFLHTAQHIKNISDLRAQYKR
jgi:hypothetical protein